MPKAQQEENKKHGDKLESVIDRIGSGSARDEEDPTALQDDDDEDIQSDATDDRRDVGRPE